MHAAPGVHWVMRGLLLQSALDGAEGGTDNEAPPPRDAPPAPQPEPAAASPQAARVADDDRVRACQVPGCESAPMAARTYVGRCRLCVPHMRADTVQLGGELLRFCQKCNRLQALTDFEGAKHTCTARLQAHNARRRVTRARIEVGPLAAEEPRRPQRRAVQAVAALRAARTAAAPRASPDPSSAGSRSPGNSPRGAAFEPPPPQPWSAPPGDEAAILDDDALLDGLFDLGDWLSLEPCGVPAVGAEGSGSGSSAAATAAFAAAWPEAGPPNAEPSSPPGAAPDAGGEDSALFAACAAAAAAAAAAHLSHRAVHVKLPQHAHADVAATTGTTPHRHRAVLAAALPQLPLPSSLAHLFADAGVAPQAPQLAAAVRPGCTLVTLEALVPPPRCGKAPPPPRAAELLRRALASPGGAGEFLRAQEEVVVADGCGGEATWRRSDGETQERDVALAPRPPPVHPLAVLCTADAELSIQVEAEAQAEHGAVQFHCRLASGRVLPLRPGASARLVLPRCDEDGVALIEAVPAGMPLHRAGAPRPVLLTSDAAIAAEVAAAGDALLALEASGGGGSGDDVARAHVDRAVLALGAALSPGASAAAVAAGAAAALWMGWAAALSALLRSPAFAAGDCDSRLLSLLRHAAASPRPAMIRALLAASPTLRRGGALAAALTAEARNMGHCHPPFAAAAALDALAARQGAAAEATAEAAEAAGKLLRAAAAELDAAQANADAESNSETEIDGEDDVSDEVIEVGSRNSPNIVAISQAKPSSSLDADVHAFRSTALVILLQYAVCAFFRHRYPPLPAEAVFPALPCPEWRIWVRMPTALCCNGASGPVVAAREAAFAAMMLLAFAPGAFARARAVHVASLHVAAMSYFFLVEPALCALATHALFGVAIRQPWQGGVKQAALTLGTHLSTEQRLPQGAHAAMLLLRGALPLVVRAAQAQGPMAAPPVRLLAQLRLLPVHVAWDVAHAALALGCVAHAQAARMRRRSAQAAAGKAKKE